MQRFLEVDTLVPVLHNFHSQVTPPPPSLNPTSPSPSSPSLETPRGSTNHLVTNCAFTFTAALNPDKVTTKRRQTMGGSHPPVTGTLTTPMLRGYHHHFFYNAYAALQLQHAVQCQTTQLHT